MHLREGSGGNLDELACEGRGPTKVILAEKANEMLRQPMQERDAVKRYRNIR